jgi:hypothetical protein
MKPRQPKDRVEEKNLPQPTAADVRPIKPEPTVDEHLPRAEFLELRKVLAEGEKQSYQDFDKAIVTLSGGAFALSLTFIQFLEKANNAWIVATSWLFFITSLLLTLISFISASFAFRRQIEFLDLLYTGNLEKYRQINRPDRITLVLNIASALSFIIGVVFLSVFTYYTLP